MKVVIRRNRLCPRDERNYDINYIIISCVRAVYTFIIILYNILWYLIIFINYRCYRTPPLSRKSVIYNRELIDSDIIWRRLYYTASWFSKFFPEANDLRLGRQVCTGYFMINNRVALQNWREEILCTYNMVFQSKSYTIKYTPQSVVITVKITLVLLLYTY